MGPTTGSVGRAKDDVPKKNNGYDAMNPLMLSPYTRGVYRLWFPGAGDLCYIDFVRLPGSVFLSAIAASALALESSTTTDRPWGRLEVVPIRIRLPDEMLPDGPLPMQPWIFRAGADEVRSTLERARVPPPLAESMTATYDAADGGTLRPGPPLLRELAPDVRGRLYEVLRRIPGNRYQQSPHKFSRVRIDVRFRELRPESRELVKEFLYERESVPSSLLLSDLPALTRLIQDPEERKRLIQAASEQESVLLRMHIDESSDAAALADYWGRGGRRRDLEILLTSLKTYEGGYDLDAIYLLPPFARAFLLSYPLPENAAKRDCFWTALNFFLPVPDDSLDGPALQRMMGERYERVLGAPKLGDILVLWRPTGEAVHAAVYIAGDIYFTKNGGNLAIPWLLMHLSDILDRYDDTRSAPLVHYRLKNVN